MKKIILLVVLLLSISQSFAQKSNKKNKRTITYVCPPCGCDGDNDRHENPGFCKHCDAKMYPIYSDVTNEFKGTPLIKKKVAILLYPNVEIIDFTGPWEVFGAAEMEVFSVAKNDSLITCFPTMKVKPDFTFSNCPKPDILLVPGGGVDIKDKETLAWINSINKDNEHTVSVCTGAYLLAEARLLDNQTVTTFLPAMPGLKQLAPTANIISDKRFVDNGKIITAAGLTSGIDVAFHVVSLYQGEAKTQELANILEYNWNRKNNYVRGKIADVPIIDFMTLFIPFNYNLMKYEGDENYWNIEMNVQSELSSNDLLELLIFKASIENKWHKLDTNQYSFKKDTIEWIVDFEVQSIKKNESSVSIKIKRGTI